jgi:hypothetical protein
MVHVHHHRLSLSISVFILTSTLCVILFFFLLWKVTFVSCWILWQNVVCSHVTKILINFANYLLLQRIVRKRLSITKFHSGTEVFLISKNKEFSIPHWIVICGVCSYRKVEDDVCDERKPGSISTPKGLVHCSPPTPSNNPDNNPSHIVHSNIFLTVLRLDNTITLSPTTHNHQKLGSSFLFFL